MAADLEMVAVFARASCIGDVRKHSAAWERTLSYPHATEESDDDVDVAALPDTTPFEFNEWFGEDAFGQLPLATLRTAELCPAAIMAEFGQADHDVGFVGYEPAPCLRAEDRDAIEARLVSLGFEVERDNEFARYLDI